MKMHRRGREYVGVLEFDAQELRDLAHLYGPHDLAYRECLELADKVDDANGVQP